MASKEPKDLVIKDWIKGIAPSPHVGFGDIRNIDIYTSPGTIRINNPLVKKSGTTVTDLILWQATNPTTTTEKYALGDTGKVYKSTDSGDTWSLVTGNTAGGVGQGMVIWKDYLFVARAAALDVYGPLSSSPSWSNSWQTITSDTLWHPMIVSYNDSMLYGGAGKYIFSIEEVSGQTFAPGNSATYTWNAQALDLPANYRIKSLSELGNNLMIGTWMGTNIYDFKIADLFSWDRSATSFGTPLNFNENGVNALINIRNSLYVQAGIEGKWFYSDGVDAVLISQIPNYIANIEGGKYIEVFPGAVANYKDKLYFGLSCGAANAISGSGIYSLMKGAKSSTLVLEHLISTGNDGTSNPLKIGSLLVTSRDTFLAGWRDNTTYGIDKINNSARYGSYTSYVDSPLYTTGTPLVKRQFTQGEFQLAKPLVSGDGIKLAYRTNLSNSFTEIGTYDYATLSAISSHNFIVNIPDCEAVQIRAYQTASSSTTPELKTVTLR